MYGVIYMLLNTYMSIQYLAVIELGCTFKEHSIGFCRPAFVKVILVIYLVNVIKAKADHYEYIHDYSFVVWHGLQAFL